MWRRGDLWPSKTCSWSRHWNLFLLSLLSLTAFFTAVGEIGLHAYTRRKIHFNTTHNLHGHINCTTSHLIYIITCTKCHLQYIWETGRKLKFRITEHISSIRNNTGTAIGAHFNSSGHTVNHMHVSAIESLQKSTGYRKVKELFWINKLQTFRFGLTKKIITNFISIIFLFFFFISFLFLVFFSAYLLGWVYHYFSLLDQKRSFLTI